MLKNIIATTDPIVLLTGGFLLFAGLCLISVTIYNFYYIRQNKRDFYEVFSSRKWVDGATWEYPSFLEISSFIFNFIVWKCILKFKRQTKRQDKLDKTVLVPLFIVEEDVLNFETKHFLWLKINILMQILSIVCVVLMCIYAIFECDQ